MTLVKEYVLVGCLMAPTWSFSTSPLSGFHAPRLGVRLGTSYYESSSDDGNKVTSIFTQPVVPSKHSSGTSSTSPKESADEVLDEFKFLNIMDQEIPALALENAREGTVFALDPSPQLEIVPETAVERLACLAVRANSLVAKYNEECEQIRRSGTEAAVMVHQNRPTVPVMSPFALLGLTIATSSMLMNANPDFVHLLSFDSEVSTLEFQALARLMTDHMPVFNTMALQESIIGSLVVAKESLMSQASQLHVDEKLVSTIDDAKGAFATFKDALFFTIGDMKTATLQAIQQQVLLVQDLVRASVDELKVTLENANQALLLTAQQSTSTLTESRDSLLSHVGEVNMELENTLQQVRTGANEALIQVDDLQELINAKVSTIELPKVDGDLVIQQWSGIQSDVMAKVEEAQEIALGKAASVELPKLDVDAMQPWNALQDSVTVNFKEGLDLVMTKAANLEVPKVDMDDMLQQFIGVQSTVMANFKEGLDLVVAKAANVDVPKVVMDDMLQQFNGVQSTVMANVKEIQELARHKAANVEIPEVDVEDILQNVNSMQGALMSRTNEFMDATIAKASSMSAQFWPSTGWVDKQVLLRQQINDYAIHSTSMLTKAIEGAKDVVTRDAAMTRSSTLAQQLSSLLLINPNTILDDVAAVPEPIDVVAVAHIAKAAVVTNPMPTYVF